MNYEYDHMDEVMPKRVLSVPPRKVCQKICFKNL